jgi:hypothetical protein
MDGRKYSAKHSSVVKLASWRKLKMNKPEKCSKCGHALRTFQVVNIKIGSFQVTKVKTEDRDNTEAEYADNVQEMVQTMCYYCGEIIEGISASSSICN